VATPVFTPDAQSAAAIGVAIWSHTCCSAASSRPRRMRKPG